MFHHPLVAGGAAVLLLAAGSAGQPVVPNTSGGCDATSPRATRFIATANATFPHLDSLRVTRLGWRKAPKSVTLVKDAKKCDAVVAAHNRFVNGNHKAYHLTTAVVAQADGSYLVEVPPGNGVAQNMIFVYDSSLTFTAIY
ncbi:MAG: hypothetical protein ACREK8_05730 [Gemmatimonadales bacterium]